MNKINVCKILSGQWPIHIVELCSIYLVTSQQSKTLSKSCTARTWTLRQARQMNRWTEGMIKSEHLINWSWAWEASQECPAEPTGWSQDIKANERWLLKDRLCIITMLLSKTYRFMDIPSSVLMAGCPFYVRPIWRCASSHILLRWKWPTSLWFLRGKVES